MKRRIMCLSLAVIMAFALLAGCAPGNENSVTTSPNNSATPPAVTTPPNDGDPNETPTAPDTTDTPTDAPPVPTPDSSIPTLTPGEQFTFPDVAGFQREEFADYTMYANDNAAITIVPKLASDEDVKSIESGLSESLKTQLAGEFNSAVFAEEKLVDILGRKAREIELTFEPVEGAKPMYSRALLIPSTGKFMMVYAIGFEEEKTLLLTAYDEILKGAKVDTP